MKYSDKAVVFVSNGERSQLLEDLDSFFVDPPLADQLAPLSTSTFLTRLAFVALLPGVRFAVVMAIFAHPIIFAMVLGD